MTDLEQRLSEIEARANAATVGPWTYTCYDWETIMVSKSIDAKPVAYVPTKGPEKTPDSRFIAHAREDIPWLIAELRKALKAQSVNHLALGDAIEERDALKTQCQSLQESLERAEKMLKEAQAKCHAMREALEWYAGNDWSGAPRTNDRGQRARQALVELCRLCDGSGERLVRQPPYDDTAALKVEECCDCHGTGQRTLQALGKEK